MIISTGRNYVFVHIPKTGGTSLALALEARAMRDDIMVGDTPKAQRRKKRLRALTPAGRLWKHSTLADIDGVLSPAQLADMFTFTLVRNPWDRAVSYYHWLRTQTFAHPAVTLAQQVGFERFWTDPDQQSAWAAMPAAQYMRDATGAETCSLYIRLEHFAEDAAPLFAHLGFELDLPRVNASMRDRDYQSYYSAALKDLIGEISEPDIVRFGYRFEA